MKTPRVLVISHNSFSDTQNNGKTLSSFFSGWPKEKLAQFYLWPELPDMTVCNNFFRITDYEILNSFLNGKKVKGDVFYKELLQNNDALRLSGLSKRFFSQRGNNGGKGIHLIIHKLFKKRVPLALIIRDILWGFNKWKTPGLKKWIDDFSPEIVFFQGSNAVFAYQIANWIADNYRIPIVLSITDDYVTKKFTLSPFEWLYHLRLSRHFSRTVNRAAFITVIGDKMKEEYSRRFGGNYMVLMNCVDVLEPVNIGPLRKEKIKFLYAGSLHTNRWKTLSIIGKCLKEISGNDTEIEFDIYCPRELSTKEISSINIPPVMKYCGRLTPDELREQISKSDVLVHVEAFDLKSRQITRLSVSTKIPEYMAAGKIFLAVGPSNVASIQYLKENDLATVITTLDEQIIIKEIKKMIGNPQDNICTVKKALGVVKERHNAENIREQLRNKLIDAAFSGGLEVIR